MPSFSWHRWGGRARCLAHVFNARLMVQYEATARALQGPGQDLYGTRKLRKRGVKLPPHMNGSGGIERNIGILVVHRMKRRGMGWTRRGAANLLAVRTALLNRPQTPRPRVS